MDLQWVDLMYRYARLPLHCFPHRAPSAPGRDTRGDPDGQRRGSRLGDYVAPLERRRDAATGREPFAHAR